MLNRQRSQFRDRSPRPNRPTVDQWLDEYALRLAESRRRLDDLGGRVG